MLIQTMKNCISDSISALRFDRTTAALLPLLYAYLCFTAQYDLIDAKRRDGLCDPREFYDEVEGKHDSYMQCTPKFEQIGEWEELKCPKNHKFLKRLQKCVDRKTFKRQQSSCAAMGPEFTNYQQQQPSCQPSSCSATNAYPSIGNPCSWNSAGLMPYPANSNAFLQCSPQYQGASCGSWQQMACSGGTSFNPTLQVCTTNAAPGACAANYQPICPCASQSYAPSPQPACPSSCVCQQQTCCQPTPPPLPPPQPQLPICSNGVQSISFCQGLGQAQCPPGYTCQNGGCCQVPIPICPRTGQPAVATCVGTGQASCPSNYQCENGGCCPAALPPCPDGQSATSFCAGAGPAGCPQGQICQNGGCCPLPVCPLGGVSVQFCFGAGCPGGFYCANGGCCPLPVCPNGQPAVQVCTNGGVCPNGFQCQNGGCCPIPLPTCLNGQQATAACTGPGTCPAQQYCFQNGCCPIPICPNGQTAVQPCDGNMPCPTGFQCQGGGCCPIPLPQCPMNAGLATQACTGPGTCGSGFYCYQPTNGAQAGCCAIPICPTGQQAVAPCTDTVPCPQGFACQNGGCCPLPTCPNGQSALQMCQGVGQGTCPANFECQNGGCCALPNCPSGQPGRSSCQGSGQANCPPGFICQNGACCPQPPCPDGTQPVQNCGVGAQCPSGFNCIGTGCCRVTCPDGAAPVQTCGVGGTCPAGFQCYQSQCCPVPRPICPNGQQAVQICQGTGQSSCPNGFSCVNGGCCIQQVAPPQCPYPQQPVCYCATFNLACPQQTACNTAPQQQQQYNSGTCCASPSSSYYNTVRPGDECRAQTQCPPGGFSACINGYCVCQGGSRSNGVTCIYRKKSAKRLKFIPGVNCGQFGADCERLKRAEERSRKGVRRKPVALTELGIAHDQEPLFWYTFQEGNKRSYCNSTADCTPDKTCLNNRCYTFLLPGERGCELDEQCQRACPGSLCTVDTASNSTVCQCESGRVLFDRKCWTACPAHTVQEGTTCVKSDMNKVDLKGFASRILGMFSAGRNSPEISTHRDDAELNKDAEISN